MRLIICLGILCLLACQSSRPTAASDDRLVFSTSGGFTGEVREYALHLDDGELLAAKVYGPRDTTELPAMRRLGRVTRSTLSDIQAMLDSEDLTAAAEGNSTGNMTRTLDYYHDGQRETLRWSSTEPAPTPTLEQLFSRLMTEVRRLSNG